MNAYFCIYLVDGFNIGKLVICSDCEQTAINKLCDNGVKEKDILRVQLIANHVIK